MDPGLLIAGAGLVVGNGLVVLAGAVKVTRWAGGKASELALQVSKEVGAVRIEMSRLAEQVIQQNHRVLKLEDGVMYRDTCEAVHAQTGPTMDRLGEDVRALRVSLEKHTAEIAALLERTREQRSGRGLPPDYEPGGATGG